MLNTILIVVLVITLLMLAGFFLLGNMSKNENPPGLLSGHLSPCPDSPNCVVSEIFEGDPHYVSPVPYPAAIAEESMNLAKQTIHEIGGEITIEEKAYISAIFTSTIFGFVDDLECRIDNVDHMIHLRSASRVGHNDFGTNRKRVELISTQFRKKVEAAVPKIIPPKTSPTGQI